MQELLDFENINHIADKLYELAKPGSIISINGPLGAGKTTLIKKIVEKDSLSAQSPSFLHTLLYGEKFAHIDAYTLRGREELFAQGIEELLETRCVFIEWGNLFENEILLFEAKVIKVEIAFSGQERIISWKQI